jgi:type II secretory ATPase GspE/PulE/Tfp pilus assembly ATPase PilB-like protein
LVSSTIEGVMAQRLVRTLCEECKEAWMPSYDEVPDDFPIDEFTAANPVFRAKGCRSCRGTGYSGRIGIYELLVSNDEIRQLANERQSSIKIKRAAMAAGMVSLREDGWRKVARGMTSIEEVQRVSKSDSGNRIKKGNR